MSVLSLLKVVGGIGSAAKSARRMVSRLNSAADGNQVLHGLTPFKACLLVDMQMLCQDGQPQLPTPIPQYLGGHVPSETGGAITAQPVLLSQSATAHLDACCDYFAIAPLAPDPAS